MATEENERISVSGVPKDLLEKIDKIADKNNRDRSKEVVFALEQYYQDKLIGK